MGEVFRYKRVLAQDGKHAGEDFKVTIGGIAPTHGELLALLAGILKAERRYCRPGELGPYLLWSFIDSREPLFASSWETIERLAVLADEKKKSSR